MRIYSKTKTHLHPTFYSKSCKWPLISLLCGMCHLSSGHLVEQISTSAWHLDGWGWLGLLCLMPGLDQAFKHVQQHVGKCGLYYLPHESNRVPQPLGHRWVLVHDLLGNRQEVSSGWNQNHPSPPRPWKNCLPWNWCPVPKTLGTTDLMSFTVNLKWNPRLLSLAPSRNNTNCFVSAFRDS